MTIKTFIKSFTVFACLFIFVQSALSITIVNFPLTTNNTPSVYSTGNSNCTFIASGGRSFLTDPNIGIKATGWGSGTYWATTAINTSDFYQITVAGQISSEETFGPRDFKLQWSNDNTNWTDVSNLPQVTDITTGFSPISLPTECAFQSTLYIRFLNYTNTAIDGTEDGIDFDAESRFKGLVIAGEQIAAPTTQASNISLVAITPTSIKLDCSPGSGNNRIIVMNTTNSFVSPTNDYNPTANTTYSSGQQVIYNGSGTSVTVIVPSSKNEYWFRVYDYNLYDYGKIRYITTENTLNPKQCLLENVILPTGINIELITAYLGGTITNPASGTITERGIYWSTSSGVSVNSSKVIEGNKSTGTFSFQVTLPRSSTIYFKAYVNNLSGTALSEEVSFSNIPIFNGVGNWEDASKWNVSEVPGLANSPIGSNSDSPVINGTCTITASSTTVKKLTINSGHSLIINPAQSIIAASTLTNDAGTSGIIIKASPTLQNGSLKFRAGTPSGTVEMYSKANWDLTRTTPGTKYAWQFFGIPVKTLSYSSSFSNCHVREWDESVSNYDSLWVKRNDGSSLTLGSGSTLVSGKGYELVQQSPKIYTFKGQFETSSLSKSMPYTTNAAYPGQHIFANPYTAAIDIEKITFGDNTEKSVYLYNTGTYSDWSSESGEITTGSASGQYTVATPLAAGGNGVPNQIPSMQAFLVKATNSAGGSINVSFTSALTPNTDRQRAPSKITTAKKVSTRIDISSTHSSDRMWIFTSPDCTKGFDNGWDGHKMLGLSQTTQIFSMEKDGEYQINGVDNMNDTYLGFHAGEDKEFKLIFTHENSESVYSKIYLVDLIENKTIDVTMTGSEYTFSADSNSALTKRFKIITKPNISDSEDDEKSVIISSSEKTIYINNRTNFCGNLIIYNINGVAQKSFAFNANTLKSFPTSKLAQGVYLARAFVGDKEITERIIIQ